MTFILTDTSDESQRYQFADIWLSACVREEGWLGHAQHPVRARPALAGLFARNTRAAQRKAV